MKGGLNEIKAKEVETRSGGKPSFPHADSLATLNVLNTLLEMLKCSLLLIHTLLYTLKSLLEMLKLRSEASLILIYAILHRIESSITDYCELLHMSAK